MNILKKMLRTNLLRWEKNITLKKRENLTVFPPVLYHLRHMMQGPTPLTFIPKLFGEKDRSDRSKKQKFHAFFIVKISKISLHLKSMRDYLELEPQLRTRRTSEK